MPRTTELVAALRAAVAPRAAGPGPPPDSADPAVDGAEPAIDGADPAADPGPQRSAVLVLAASAVAGVPLLFIRRSRQVSTHQGQIAFPGGRVEPGDDGPTGTALREAAEELGIDADAVEVLGQLEPLVGRAGDLHIEPVVALAAAPLTLHPDPFEVAEHFWIGLDRLLEAPVTRRVIPGDPAERLVSFIDLGEPVIWGLTAAIVLDLCARVRGVLRG